MFNINKPNPYIKRLLKDKYLSTKIFIYFSTKTAENDYDPYEKNFTYTDLNYKCIKGYVTQLTPTSLVWKNYGLQEQGALEVLTEKKYQNWFEICSKIVINGDTYIVFKEATGGRMMITSRPFEMIRVVLSKKEGS